MQKTSSAPQAAETLQQAWLARWNQQIETAIQKFADFRSQMNWNEVSPELLKTVPRPQREIYIEALLLKSSLLRAQGQVRSASALLRRVLSAHEELGEVRGFRLLFELGINHWIEQDLAEALDAFLMAERKARCPEEKVFSNSNVLWCLESLDLERSQAEENLSHSLAQVKEAAKVKHALEQWQAYLLRRDFFRDLKIPSDPGEIAGQGAFFVQWAQALPYSQRAMSSEVSLWPDYLWQGTYRTRTLAGIWVPGDSACDRVGDAIDRLYLWTWLWMARSTHMSGEKVHFTLHSILENLNEEHQAQENLLLLRNSLMWISLMEPAQAKELSPIFKRLSGLQAGRYPVLEVEYALAQKLAGEAGDFDQILRRFSVFAKIAKQTVGSRAGKVMLPLLRERLSVRASAENHCGGLVVDLLRNEIRSPEGRTIHSPFMVRLIKSLNTHARVPFASLLSPEQDPKTLQNAVTRLKKMTSPGAVLIRRQEVWRGSEWKGAQILHSDRFEPRKSMEFKFEIHRARVSQSEAHFQAARALLQPTFTRRQLERHLRISKATACRVLDEWIRAGKISVHGRAKAIIYHWAQSAPEGR